MLLLEYTHTKMSGPTLTSVNKNFYPVNIMLKKIKENPNSAISERSPNFKISVEWL